MMRTGLFHQPGARKLERDQSADLHRNPQRFQPPKNAQNAKELQVQNRLSEPIPFKYGWGKLKLISHKKLRAAQPPRIVGGALDASERNQEFHQRMNNIYESGMTHYGRQAGPALS
jgi:hypothetical protein